MSAQYPKMLYKTGGTEEMHGGKFATLIVEHADDEESALAAGWCTSTCAARAKMAAPTPVDDAPPTRDELEAEAARLGLKYDGRISDKKLAALIATAHAKA